jgi:uncharacterized protein
MIQGLVLISWNMENILFDKISRTIVQELDPEEIIIFGFYAKDEQTQDSDLDILIILKKYSFDVNSRLKIISAMRKSLVNINIPKDILIFDETEIDE